MTRKVFVTNVLKIIHLTLILRIINVCSTNNVVTLQRLT